MNFNFVKVLNAATEWLQHDWETRKHLVWPLLQNVRLGLIPIEDIRRNFRDTRLWDIAECREVYVELLEYHTIFKQMGPHRKGHVLETMANCFVLRKSLKVNTHRVPQ